MLSFVVALASFLIAEDGALFRFGGEAAVPGADASLEAPVEVAPRPFKPDAVYRTRGGAWRFYDGARDRVVELPIVGERLVGWSANGGSLLTSLGEGRVLRWKATNWTQLAEMKTTHAPEATAVSPDGHHVLVTGPNPDGRGRRFTLFGGTVGLQLRRVDREDALEGAPLALSDERAVIVRAGQLEVLTLPRLEAERVIPIGDEVRALAFGPDGSEVLVLRGDDGELTIERYTVATSERAGVVTLPDGCGRGAMAANGRLAACVLERPTRAVVIELPSGTTRATFRAPAGHDPVLDPAGTRVAFPGNRGVPLWDATADGVLPAAARAGAVRALAPIGDGRVAALEASGVLRVWDPATGTETFRVPKPAAALATSPDGVTLISGGSPLTAISEASGDTAWTVKGSRPVAVGAASDGRVFWIERGGDLKVRSAQGKVKRLARPPRGPKTGGVPRLVVSPDGREILYGTRVVDATTGKPVRDVAPGMATWAGSAVAIVGETGLAAGAVVFADVGAVTALAGDGTLVVAGDKDGVVHVWTADGQRVLRRGMHRGPVLAVAVDATRRRVYSAGSDGVILGTTWGP